MSDLHSRSATLLPAIALLTAGLVAQDTRPVLIEAATLHLAPGETLVGQDARLLVRDGKIAGVGRAIGAEAAQRARKITFEGATIAPGLVLVHDLLGARTDLAETIDAFTPDLRAADAFDPFSEELVERAHSGVTSVTLAPASANTFGGISCVVKHRVVDEKPAGVIATPDGYLKLALVAESLTDDRPPTSRMGAADLIRSTFAAASDPLGPRTPALDTLRSVMAGAVPVAIHARSHAEITAALDLADELELEPTLLECTELEDTTIERLRGRAATVALAALDYDSTAEQLRVPARLAEANIRFSFVGSDGHALRRAAALAVRNGLSRDVARAAITQVPAEQSNVGDRVGALRVGRDADFLILTGDPVDQSSQLLEVWIDGRVVHTNVARSSPSGSAPVEVPAAVGTTAQIQEATR